MNMFCRSLLVNNAVVFILLQDLSQATPGVISLPTVPTSACVGKQGVGSATYSSEFPGNTGDTLNIYSGGYATQKGGLWKLWVDSNIKFDTVGVAGAGATNEDGNDSLQKLLKINSDGHSINLNVTDEGTWDHQIVIEITQAEKRKIRKARAAASSTTTSKKAASSTATAPIATAFVVTATGQWPCSSEPGLGTTLSVNPASSNVATLCSQNQIPLNSDAWTQYGAQSYLSSLYTSARTAPGHSNIAIPGQTPIPAPKINWADALRHDVGVTQVCQWNQQCNPIQCADVRGQGPIDKQDPARFLAYNSFANLNNIFWQLYEGLLNAAELGVIPNSGTLVKTFYTLTPPSIIWADITGVLAPAISVFSTVLGLLPDMFSLELRTFITVVSGGLYEADALQKLDLGKVLEQSWEADADLSTIISSYVTNMTSIVEAVYTNSIANTGLVYTNFTAGGAGLQNYDSQATEKNWSDKIVASVSGVFFMRAINYLMTQDDAFVMWVPYGVDLVIYNRPFQDDSIPDTMKPTKNFTKFSQKDCEDSFQTGDNGKVFTSCTAGDVMPGMGRIYSITDKVKSDTYNSAVTGWNSGYKIPGGWKFNLPDVIDGAVRSWQQGGFDFSLDSVTKTATDSSIYDLLQNWKNSPQQPGMFTIPVCAPVVAYPDGTKSSSKTTNTLAPFPDGVSGTTGFAQGYGSTIWTQCENGYEFKKFSGTAFKDKVAEPISSALKSYNVMKRAATATDAAVSNSGTATIASTTASATGSDTSELSAK